MNAEEYREVIARLGLTQVGAARFLGVDETTSRRWISGRHPIPLATAMLLRTMVRHRLTPASVARHSGEPKEEANAA